MISEDGEFVHQRGQMMKCPEEGQQLTLAFQKISVKINVK